MTLVARIALAKRVPADSGVSYGHLYVTDRETTLGLVPLGYADGILRHATGRVEVLAGGRRRAIAGRVCMDQFMIDMGDDPLAAGDEVILFGPGTAGSSVSRAVPPIKLCWPSPLTVRRYCVGAVISLRRTTPEYVPFTAAMPILALARQALVSPSIGVN